MNWYLPNKQSNKSVSFTLATKNISEHNTDFKYYLVLNLHNFVKKLQSKITTDKVIRVGCKVNFFP